MSKILDIVNYYLTERMKTEHFGQMMSLNNMQYLSNINNSKIESLII